MSSESTEIRNGLIVVAVVALMLLTVALCSGADGASPWRVLSAPGPWGCLGSSSPSSPWAVLAAVEPAKPVVQREPAAGGCPGGVCRAPSATRTRQPVLRVWRRK